MQTRRQNMRIARVEPEFLEQFNDLLRYAFQVTEEDLLHTGWEGEDMRKSKSPILERAHVLGWFDGDQLVSQIAVYPLRQNVHGRMLSMGFVTGVSTYPEYTGMGLMSELMQRCLQTMREAGQSISLLYPYSIPLYRRKGWEIISDKMTFKVKDSQLPEGLTAPGFVQRVEADNPDLLSLHDLHARRTHGCIERGELAWGEYWRWEVDDTTVALYYDAAGQPAGFLVYLIKEDVLHIKEIVTLQYEAWVGLWAYIAAHASMVGEVRGSNYTNQSLAFWFPDSEMRETIRPYMMARIVDVAAFLSLYPFRDAGEDFALTFRVEDELLDWNQGDFSLSFQTSGLPELIQGEAPHVVSLSIGTLTTLLMSYRRPAYLREIGRLETDDQTLALLERIIPLEKASISDYM